MANLSNQDRDNSDSNYLRQLPRVGLTVKKTVQNGDSWLSLEVHMSEDVEPGHSKGEKLEALAEQSNAWLMQAFREAGVLD